MVTKYLKKLGFKGVVLPLPGKDNIPKILSLVD
jgi:hypothetical protein